MNAALDGEDAPIAEGTVGTHMTVDAEGRLIVQRFEDVEPLIEHLAALRQDSDGKSKTGELYHVGDIPMSVVESYCNQAGITFNAFINEGDTHIKRILQNPDFSKFRVWQGRF